MSQADVLLPPQNSLTPVVCDLRKQSSPSTNTTHVKGRSASGGEPSVGHSTNDKGKQQQRINGGPSSSSRGSNTKTNEQQPNKKSVSFNGDVKVQQQNRNKKKHRRGKKRKWKPYNKLTWEERKEMQDREARRAERIRAEMCACGLTLAPYNTTQFLMDDHNLQEPDYDHIPGTHLRQRTCGDPRGNDSSDEFYSSPSDEEDFLQQQFTETYRSMHAERLSDMSKEELVQELMSIEDRLESLQKRLDEVSAGSAAKERESSLRDRCLEEQLEKIRVFKEEISKLTSENDKLRQENDELRTRSGSTDSVVV